MTQPLALIPYPCGWGAKIRECADGPEYLQHWQLAEKLSQLGIDCEWQGAPYVELELQAPPEISPAEAFPLVIEYGRSLCEQVQATVQNNALFPVAIGGDNSMSVGMWNGIASGVGCIQNFGLIWIDAHLDAHLPNTSPSGAWHGMPVAALLDYGKAEWRSIGGKGAALAPRHLFMIGTRSYEREEHELLQQLGVRIVPMDEVHRRGMEDVMQEAVSYVTQDTKGFGISVDLDAFDPAIAPGVACPEQGGINREEGLAALFGLGHHPMLRGVEIAEFNPNLDRGDATAQLILEVLTVLFVEAESH